MPTLLLVDDDELLTRAIKLKLKNSINDLTVITANTCEDALKIASNCPPEVLLVDYWLPDGDGLSLRKQLADKVTDLPTIMMSACWDDFGRNEAEEEHALNVFDKPINMNRLVAAVHAALAPPPAKDGRENIVFPRETNDSAVLEKERFPLPHADVPDRLYVEEMLADVLNDLKNVLVVDPSHLNAEMCKTLFAPYPDCRIELARNGTEAFIKLQTAQCFDLIIVERNLPDMEGNHFLEELTKQGHRHIPTIVVTNSKEKRNILSAMQAGAMGYVIKPWRSSHFRKLLKIVIEEQKRTSSRSLLKSNAKMSIPVASFHDCYEYTE